MIRTKKFLALLLALAMVLGMSTTAFAATEVSNTQDPNVLTLTSTGNTVTYTAVTVEGDPDNTGTGYADVTTYSYYISLPSNSSSSALSAVSITAVYPLTHSLKIDGSTKAFSVADGKKSSTFTIDMSNGAKEFYIYQGTTQVRSFVVSAGISGATLPNVTMRINIQNAYSWLAEGNTMDSMSSAGLNYLKTATGITVTNNVASDMGAITLAGLPAGSTAMDALYYICNGVTDNSGVTVRMADGTYITASGLGIDLDGTGNDGSGKYTYIAAMGNDSTNAWLGEFSTETLSGWLYLDRQDDGTYNMPNYGAAQYNLVGGEDIVWLFTNEFGDYDILW